MIAMRSSESFQFFVICALQSEGNAVDAGSLIAVERQFHGRTRITFNGDFRILSERIEGMDRIHGFFDFGERDEAGCSPAKEDRDDLIVGMEEIEGVFPICRVRLSCTEDELSSELFHIGTLFFICRGKGEEVTVGTLSCAKRDVYI